MKMSYYMNNMSFCPYIHCCPMKKSCPIAQMYINIEPKKEKYRADDEYAQYDYEYNDDICYHEHSPHEMHV